MGFSQSDFIRSDSKDHTSRLLIPKIIFEIKIFENNFQDGNSSHKCLYTLGSKI